MMGVQVVTCVDAAMAAGSLATLVSMYEEQAQRGAFACTGVHQGSTWVFAELVPCHGPAELQAALMAAADAAVPDVSAQIWLQVGQSFSGGAAPHMLVRSPGAPRALRC